MKLVKTQLWDIRMGHLLHQQRKNVIRRKGFRTNGLPCDGDVSI